MKKLSLWSGINKCDPNGCWLWTRSTNVKGYGTISWCGKICRVHRVVYELLVGKIKPQHDLHHKETCPKKCCNPEHMTEVPHDNHPGSAPDIQRNKTHCKRGHELSGDNLYIHPTTKARICQKCRLHYNKLWKRLKSGTETKYIDRFVQTKKP